MRTNLFRGLILGTLIFTLLFPAGEIRAWAQAKDKQQPKAPAEQTPGGFSISVTVPVVTVDVVDARQEIDIITERYGTTKGRQQREMKR